MTLCRNAGDGRSGLWTEAWKRVFSPRCCCCGSAAEGALGQTLCAACALASGIAPAGPYRHAVLDGRDLYFVASYWSRVGASHQATPAAACLLRFKHRRDRHAGRSLARAFASALGGVASAFDAVVAIPPSPERARVRGLDPAAWLSRRLAAHARVPFRSDLLERSFGARAQRGLDGSQRRRNVRGSFRLCSHVPRRYSLVLVDDVCTTGSTLAEAAALLEGAGAGRVALAVLTCADGEICRQCPTTID